MKRVFVALTVLTLVGPLAGGCAQLQALGNVAHLATASIANPVTPDKLYAVEASMRIAITALQTYKRACAANAADKACRSNVAAVQKFTSQIPPYLAQLRAFVKNNDQINAVNTYNILISLYTQAKTTAANLGVSIGG